MHGLCTLQDTDCVSEWLKRKLKSEEITGGRINLYEEELHNLYSSPDVIRMINGI
jgi:hypothetical protein